MCSSEKSGYKVNWREGIGILREANSVLTSPSLSLWRGRVSLTDK